MPVWLISVFTNKYTWYALGGVALAALLYFKAYQPYEDMKAQAALVPALQASVKQFNDLAKSNETRAGALSKSLNLEKQRSADAETLIVTFKGNLDVANHRISEITKNEAASKNPVCLPSPDARGLWNETIASSLAGNAATGPAPASGGVP